MSAAVDAFSCAVVAQPRSTGNSTRKQRPRNTQDGPSSDVNKVVRLKDGRVWHGLNLGLVGSGVCEIKYRFEFPPGGDLAALPPSGSKLIATSNGPNLSEKKGTASAHAHVLSMLPQH